LLSIKTERFIENSINLYIIFFIEFRLENLDKISQWLFVH